MTKKQLLFVGLSALFFALALAIDYSSFLLPNMEVYTSRLEKELHKKEKEVNDLFDKEKEKEFFANIIDQNPNAPNTSQQKDNSKLLAMSNAAYTIHIYKGNKLVFWSNNLADFSEHIDQLKSSSLPQFLKLANGYYEVIRKPLMLPITGDYTGIGLIPIKYDYKLESKYLLQKYLVDLPQQISVTDQVTEYGLTTRGGSKLCYFDIHPPLQDSNYIAYSLYAYLLAFFFLGLFINSIARHLAMTRQLWMGASVLVGSLFGLKWLGSMTNFTEKFNIYPIFQSAPADFMLSDSLGDLLINILLLLWVIIFFHRQYKMPSYTHLGKGKKMGLIFINAFAIVIAILQVCYVFKELIYDSAIDFNFQNVFDLSEFSMVAIWGVILLLIALFLFSHLMMMMILSVDMPRNSRQLAYSIAILAGMPVAMFLNLDLQLLLLGAFLIFYLALFDVFVDNDSNALTWLVIWLVILGAFSSYLLYQYNNAKDAKSRLHYAKALVDERDSIAEIAIDKLYNELKTSNILDVLQGEFPDKTPTNLLTERINKYYANNGYLFNNYEYTVNAFYGDSETSVIDKVIPLEVIKDRLANSKSTTIENLKITENTKIAGSYLLEMNMVREVEPLQTIDLIFEFSHKERKRSKVYTELLSKTAFKNLKGLNQYDYGVYKNDSLVYSSNNKFSTGINSLGMAIPAADEEINFSNNNKVGLIYKSKDDSKIVVLRKDSETVFQSISLFSYIFSLLIIFMLLLSGINTFIQILPRSLSFAVIQQPSLRNRVQIAVISLILVSFIFIGSVTTVYFSNTHEEYHENRLVRKIQSVIGDTQHEMELLFNKKDNDEIEKIQFVSKTANEKLKELDLKAISKIHRLDINVYNLEGQLVKSSEMDVFEKGIISMQMNALAYQALAKDREAEYIEDKEFIGQLGYTSAYIPLTVSDGRKEELIAFLGLPYYSKQSNLREDVTVFMGTLLNVYVFLLLIAGALAIFVANSITRPITALGDKLKEFHLGGKNSRLQWSRQDELGVLIEEYNRMVQKIEDSTELLAQSEREGAWREMAKQVAHEIKNPLTPMKLSIQYLQHAYRSNAEDIEPLLKRVCNTMIEQIDNLSQIASEFSNFAKMPRAENQKIEINHLVSSVYDLFKEHRDKHVTLSMPNDDLYIYADKNQLIRVLNNLVKNAIQAIPEDRKGEIHISLYEEKSNAVVKVQDNGCGISDDKKEKVFVPNFTTKNSGTGLGLAISKNIIESVSGSIYFETQVDIGTTFYVELPIIEVYETEIV